MVAAELLGALPTPAAAPATDMCIGAHELDDDGAPLQPARSHMHAHDGNAYGVCCTAEARQLCDILESLQARYAAAAASAGAPHRPSSAGSDGGSGSVSGRAGASPPPSEPSVRSGAAYPCDADASMAAGELEEAAGAEVEAAAELAGLPPLDVGAHVAASSRAGGPAGSGGRSPSSATGAGLEEEQEEGEEGAWGGLEGAWTLSVSLGMEVVRVAVEVPRGRPLGPRELRGALVRALAPALAALGDPEVLLAAPAPSGGFRALASAGDVAAWLRPGAACRRARLLLAFGPLRDSLLAP